MGRMFIARIAATSVVTQRDIVEVVAGTGVPIIVHEILVTTSVETDANEEQIPCKLSRRTGAFTSGAGGTVASAYALGVLGAANDSATVEFGNTTQATGGGEEIFSEPYINNRIGWHYLPTPETRPTIDATDALILAMTAAAANAAGFGGHIVFEELVG